MQELEARAKTKDHFDTASDDQVRSADIYAKDAVLEFPQGGERIRGRANIIAFRSAYPAKLTFEMHRTIGSGDLWVNEYTIRYDNERPHRVAGIMEFAAARSSGRGCTSPRPGTCPLGGRSGWNRWFQSRHSP